MNIPDCQWQLDVLSWLVAAAMIIGIVAIIGVSHVAGRMNELLRCWERKADRGESIEAEDEPWLRSPDWWKDQ